ncbi:GTP pyrophosphokinase [Ligilactobacillus salitolerans]|uniref:GTP pyrophosphokinase n=1 Tax=Ligilactobacillus salitolerans TaxID=1808352 RepID=A0A401IUV1_9LACO|nr:GTP pyrophosphokinase family protein [Ligilactobacillus salitolerans]GBG95267.1 GTP pyrophosphokinase [Ligilactobacillus salitolerans]
MILQRRNILNFGEMQQQLEQSGMKGRIDDFQKITQIYLLRRLALKEVGTKLENLDDEYSTLHAHNPIHHMEERMKNPTSLIEKMERKNYGVTIESVQKNIYDIAGIRVVTNYIDDIHRVEDALLGQDDITLIKRKDYINKPNGYRSLHIVVSVPVFLAEGAQQAPVEIQIRTIGMDMWASLEHKLRYKNHLDPDKAAKYGDQLKDTARQLNQIEAGMQGIYQDLL